MSLVALKDVVKSFGETRAVDEVSFTIDRGEVVGFLGPNGAGKTTTMRLLTQYLQPDAGAILIDGEPIESHPAELRRRVGYLPETNPLYTDMLAGEYISFMGHLRGMARDEIVRRTDAVVEQTAIEDVYYRPIHQLSKGYRQRVGLAQAILSEPEILILDEPTEGLDPNQRVEIRHLIRELGGDRTVLLSTHVMQEVQRTCSRVVIISQGRIVADGDVETVVSQGARGARVSIEIEGPGEAARTAILALPSIVEVEIEGEVEGRVAMSVLSDGADPRRDIFGLAADRGWPLWELRLEHESLEDVFRLLTATRPAAGPPVDATAPPEAPAGPADDPGASDGDAASGEEEVGA